MRYRHRMTIDRIVRGPCTRRIDAVRDDPVFQSVTGDLVWRPAGHLFGQNVARLAFKRGAYLRNFVYAFAELLSDRLSRNLIMRAMGAEAPTYDL